MTYNFENLEVYKISGELVVLIYSILKKFPSSELFGLVSQIKRSSTSITLNIAEGSTGRTKKDFAKYLSTAIGSLIETRAALLLSLRLGFVKEEELDTINSLIDQLFFKLIALKKSLLLP